jgi:hypothetical protein
VSVRICSFDHCIICVSVIYCFWFARLFDIVIRTYTNRHIINNKTLHSDLKIWAALSSLKDRSTNLTPQIIQCTCTSYENKFVNWLRYIFPASRVAQISVRRWPETVYMLYGYAEHWIFCGLLFGTNTQMMTATVWATYCQPSFICEYWGRSLVLNIYIYICFEQQNVTSISILYLVWLYMNCLLKCLFQQYT